MSCFTRFSQRAAAFAATLLLAGLIPAGAGAVTTFIEGKVQKYQFPAPFACKPLSYQFWMDESADNACGKSISTLFGNWTWTARPEAFMGANRYISKETQTGKEWVKWSPTITLPGRYDLWVSWRASDNRAHKTPYYVYSDQGNYHFAVDQYYDNPEYTGMKWAKLGTFYFKKRAASANPTAGYVKCVNGPDHSEGIDAVAIKYVGPQLAATKDSAEKVTLVWTAAPKNLNYEIWRGTTGVRAAATKLDTVTGVVTYGDQAAAPGVTYFYWVKATGTDAKVFWSNVAQGKDTGPFLTATNDLADRVTLTWEAVPDNQNYEVFRNTAPDQSGATKISVDPLTAVTLDDLTAVAGTPYYYWVKSTRNDASVLWSNMATGLVPTP